MQSLYSIDGYDTTAVTSRVKISAYNLYDNLEIFAPADACQSESGVGETEIGSAPVSIRDALQALKATLEILPGVPRAFNAHHRALFDRAFDAPQESIQIDVELDFQLYPYQRHYVQVWRFDTQSIC